MMQKPDRKQLSDCDRASGPVPSVDEARERIMARLMPVTAVERVGLRAALDRILGEEVMAPANVPAHTNAAMDGYALRGADLPAAENISLRLAGECFAGHPFAREVAAGECVRIMTGGVMPRGTDTVVIQEDIDRDDAGVRIGAGHKVGQHVRQAGEDLRAGERVLAAGRRLTPADLGLIASTGAAEVGVYRRVRVAFFSTGDELRPLGQPLGEGEIHDSNRYALRGVLERFGADVLDLGAVRDDPEAVRAAFNEAGAAADVVVTSGGASVGAADHVRSLLEENGEIGFWKVNMKPGRPLVFGHLCGGAAFFGLPGNPVSTMVTYYQIVQPVLNYLAGAAPALPLRVAARTTQDLRKLQGRREFLRGYMESGANGELTVRAAAPQGSGILRSMSLANCFIVLPEDSGTVKAGEPVLVEPFAGLI